MDKMRHIDASKVRGISITQVAEDWGLAIKPYNNRRLLIYCPNPAHHDEHLGSCHLIEYADKNFFYCFACGAGGSPIDLVMYIDNCDFITALNKLAETYNFVEYVSGESISRWEGLSSKEYNKLGLYNVGLKLPYGVDEKGNTLYHYERYSLRELANENPKLHDRLLKNKYIEITSNILSMMTLGQNNKLAKYGIHFDDDWEDACYELLAEYTDLFKKGMVNKKDTDNYFLSNNNAQTAM